MMGDDSIRTIIRARPLVEKEIKAARALAWKIVNNAIEALDERIPKRDRPHMFDYVFGEESTNKQLHDVSTSQAVLSCLEGYNCTVLAYGQSASGKLRTMEGSLEDPGLISRVIEQLFKIAGKDKNHFKYMIRISYLIIYEEKIYDLLKYSENEVAIRLDEEGASMICSREAVTATKDQVCDLLKLGSRNRLLYLQKLNITDSHSNTIFRVIIEHEMKDGSDSVIPISHLNLVTLAGSERLPRSEDIPRFAERDFVNRALSVLALTVNQNIAKVNPTYRESKLTVLLKNAIGGNAKVFVIGHVSLASVENTYFTLNFIQKMKKLRNKPTINIIGTTQGILSQCLQLLQVLELEVIDVKHRCAELRAVPQAMQTIDMLHDRMILVSKAFARSETTGDLADHEFRNLLSRSNQTLNLSLLETRLLNVVKANQAYNTDVIGKQNRLPFELLMFHLSKDIGNELIVQLPEDEPEELFVVDYLTDAALQRCESELEFSEKDSDVDTKSLDISFEFSELERSLSSKLTSAELKTELSNLTAIFTANYSQRLAVNKAIEKQNQVLLDEIAELSYKLAEDNKQKDELQKKISDLQTKLTAQENLPDGDLQKQYQQLLKEMDKKDTEYFQVLKERDNLHKQVVELTARVERYKAPFSGMSPPSQRKRETESVEDLQSEINILNQKIIDQEFIIAEMSNKHKRREEELLKRLSAKEVSREKIFDVPKSEKQIQVETDVEHSVSQTEERLTTSISVQVEELNLSEQITDVSEQDKSVETEVTDQSTQFEAEATTSTSCQATDLEVAQITEMDTKYLDVIEENMLQILTDTKPDDTGDQLLTINIISSARKTFEMYYKKFNVLVKLQEEFSREVDVQQTAGALKVVLYTEIQEVETIIAKARKCSVALSLVLTELKNYRAYKAQHYSDVPRQLGEQISELSKQIFELENRIETEKRNTTIARNESAAAKNEVIKLKEFMHRVIPATSEKEILQEVAEAKDEYMNLQREVFKLNNQTNKYEAEIEQLSIRNTEYEEKLKNLELDLANKTKVQASLLEDREKLEMELIMTQFDLFCYQAKLTDMEKIICTDELAPKVYRTKSLSSLPTEPKFTSLLDIVEDFDQLKKMLIKSASCPNLSTGGKPAGPCDTDIKTLKSTSLFDAEQLQIASQELQSLKGDLERELLERQKTNKILFEYCKAFKEKSTEEYIAMRDQLIKEIHVYKQKCLIVLEQNCALLEKISMLELEHQDEQSESHRPSREFLACASCNTLNVRVRYLENKVATLQAEKSTDTVTGQQEDHQEPTPGHSSKESTPKQEPSKPVRKSKGSAVQSPRSTTGKKEKK